MALYLNIYSIIQYENYHFNPELKFECKSCKKCGICDKTVAINHRKLECILCSKYIHIKCNKFDEKDYNYYETNKTSQFFCLNCLNDNLPLVSLNDKEFELTIEGINIPEETDVNTLYLKTAQVSLVHKLNKVVTDYNNDISRIDNENEYEEIPSNNCAYLSIEEFKKKRIE